MIWGCKILKCEIKYLNCKLSKFKIWQTGLQGMLRISNLILCFRWPWHLTSFFSKKSKWKVKIFRICIIFYAMQWNSFEFIQSCLYQVQSIRFFCCNVKLFKSVKRVQVEQPWLRTQSFQLNILQISPSWLWQAIQQSWWTHQ